MRYKINFDRVINQLTPYYLGGRKLILYLQSCMKPLHSVNDIFVDWAKETRIEAAMTSQVFKFEWYLNRKFQQYFNNQSERISIEHGIKLGTPIYYQSATDIPDDEQLILYTQKEGQESAVLYQENDQTDTSTFSFIVYCPKLWKDPTSGLLKNNITEKEFLSMLSFYIDKYKLSGKTYKIIINQ